MKRFDVYAGYADLLASLPRTETKKRTKMSQMDKSTNAYIQKEARVIAHKRKVGKLIMQDIELYNHISFMPSLYPFQLPVTMADAVMNTVSWQHEKTRLISQLTLDAIALLQMSEDDVEVNRDLISQIADKKFQLFLKRCDIPELPPANLGTTANIEISKVCNHGVIESIAAIDTSPTPRDHLRKHLYHDYTILENSHKIEQYDKDKERENKLYGWKPQLIRQLIAPYLDCETRFALKRAYPSEDLQPTFCQQHQFDEVFHMEYSDSISPVRIKGASNMLTLVSKSGRCRTFCICTTLIYRAAFSRDYLIMASQIEIFNRLRKNNINVDRPRTLVSNYVWQRNDTLRESSICTSSGDIFKVIDNGTFLSGYTRKRDSISWKIEIRSRKV